MSNFRSLRVSKFRHVYGQSARRENCYEGIRITGSAHDGQFCAVNPKFIAVVLEVAGGGAFQVLPLKWSGKVDYHTGRVCGHNGVVNDLKWNPFNDNVIASCSDDAKVKLWYIPDGGVKMFISHWLSEFSGHTRRVVYLEWHPTVEGLLASAGGDYRVCLWDVSKAECILSLDCHEDVIYSMAFNLDGSLLATTCKDRYLRIFDARTGDVLQEAFCHECSKASKVVFLNERRKLVTSGFSRMSHRQIAVWDQNDISSPLLVQEIDTAPGVLFPFYDSDLSLLFIAGKGDGNIRYYEVLDSAPYIVFLSEFQSKFPQKGLGYMPKRGLDVSRCEIFRFYKIHAAQSLVEPLSFIVPRKSECFQVDLYPPTPGPTPALTLDEWLCGITKGPIRISLQGNFSSVTNKPVQLKMAFDDEGHESRPTLITSDRNNERKFQFLSEITKPDYRDITQREDYPDLIKQQQLLLNMSRVHKKSANSPTCDSATNSPARKRQGSTVTRHELASSAERKKFDDHESNNEEDDEDEEESVEQRNRLSAIYSSRDSNSEVVVQVSKTTSSARTTNNRLLSSIPSSIGKEATSTNGGSDGASASSATSSSSSSSSSACSESSIGCASSASKATAALTDNTQCSASSCPPMPSAAALAKKSHAVHNANSMFRSPQAHHPDKRLYTKPGCIAPGPVVHKDPPHIVRPFRVSQSQPPTPRTSTSLIIDHDSPCNGQPGKDNEIHKLYAQQSKRLRELLAELEPKDKRIYQLEQDLSNLTLKLESVQADLALKDEDIESLRYEIAWKNKRISQLEQQLYKGGNA